MKRIALILLLLSSAAFAQNFSTVIGTQVEDASGNLLQSGTACFQPVNAILQPTGFTAGGGGRATSQSVCRTVTNGVVAPLSLASSNLTSPLGIQYAVTIYDDVANQKMSLGYMYVVPDQNGNFSLDQWSATAIKTIGSPGPSNISGALSVSGAVTANNFHGLSDASITAQRWATLPQSCPVGYSPSSQDINGNFLQCNANSYQASGTTPGMLAQDPAGSQMVTLSSGFFQRFGNPSSYAQFDFNGNLIGQKSTFSGPELDVTHTIWAADNTGTNDASTAINAAISFSLSHHVGGTIPTIYLPAGIYKLSNPIILPPCITLRGDGLGATRLQIADDNPVTGPNTGMILGELTNVNCQNFSFISVHDLEIVGDSNLTTGNMIEALGAVQWRISNVRLFNHGGAGIVMASNSERSHINNFVVVNVRWPEINDGTNENHQTDIEILGANQSGNTSNYFYNVNCPAGTSCNLTGVWKKDPHYAIFLQNADNLDIQNGSIKSLGYISGICYAGQSLQIQNVYLEAGFVTGQSNQTALKNVCQVSDVFVGATLLTSTGAPQITDWTWMPARVGEAQYASAFNKTLTMDIFCADAAVGSTDQCGSDPTHVKGKFERITFQAVTPDGVFHGVTRCASGSTDPNCTAGSGTGAVWQSGYHMMFTAGPLSGRAGNGPYIHDSHINVDENSFPGSGGSWTSSCDDHTTWCADIIAGYEPDGLEVTLPGQPSGFGGATTTTGRSPMHIGMNVYSGRCLNSTTDPTMIKGCGIIKVPYSGQITCDIDQWSNFTNSNGNNPAAMAASNSPCPYSFVNYSGTYAFGTLTAPGYYVQSPAVSAGGNFMAPFVPPMGDSMDEPGWIYKDKAGCFYAWDASGQPQSRVCHAGGANPAGLVEEIPDGSGGWNIVNSFDMTNGLQTSQLGAAKIGKTANFITNSGNMTPGTAGWSGSLPSQISSIICGQPDPDGGNNACTIVFAGAAGSWSYSNTSSGSPLSTGIPLTSCLYAQSGSGAGGEQFNFDGNTAGSLAPSQNVTLPVDSNWHLFSWSGTSNSTTHYFRIGGAASGQPAGTVKIYAPDTWSGTGCPVTQITGASASYTTQSTVVAQKIGSTLQGSATALSFGSIAANSFGLATVTVPGARNTMHGATCQATQNVGSFIIASTWVISNDTVQIALFNPASVAATPNAVSWNCSVTP